MRPILGGYYTDQVGRDLLSGIAQLIHLAAWMGFDLEQHGLAQRYMIQALRLARAAQDVAFGAEILAAMSQQALYLGRASEALDLARAAHLSARRTDMSVLVSESLVTEARALAALGDRTGSARALAAGERPIDQHDPTAAPPWIRYYDAAYLSAQLGHCLRELGDLDSAEQHAHRSLRMVDGYARGQAFNLAMLASIHAEQGEIERACAVGGQAVDIGVGLKSRRAWHRLTELSTGLDPYASYPAVREFAERARVLTPG